MRKIGIVVVAAALAWPAHAGQLRVLFVGNSYTYVNDLPRMFTALARSLGATAETGMAAPGGYTLRQHSEDPGTLARIQAGPWDVVVLQEQSQMPELSPDQVQETIVPYAMRLRQAVHAASPGARVVLFETWGRRDGDTQRCPAQPEVCTYEGMQRRVDSTYRLVADRAPATVAPVGEVWAEVRRTHPEIALYSDDGSHPSRHGTYLAACVFYAVLFDASPVGGDPLGLDPAQASALQRAAAAARAGRAPASRP
jgi:hypothetical protein